MQQIVCIFVLELLCLLITKELSAADVSPEANSALANESKEAEPAEALLPAKATTPPPKTWVIEGGLGAGQTWREYRRSSEGEDDTQALEVLESDVSTDFSVFLPLVQLGVTERLHVGILCPGIAYRFGERGKFEGVPFFRLGFAVGYSSMEGTIIALDPELGLSARHWIHKNFAFNWTLLGASHFRYRRGGDCQGIVDPEVCEQRTILFEIFPFRLSVGFIIELDERVSLAPRIGISGAWNRAENEMALPHINILGANPNGLWGTPFLRFHINKHLALGFNLGASFSVDAEYLSWQGGLDLLAIW